jgi:3-dehydroquinate synthetase
VKHGLIADQSYFEWIESAAEDILRRDPAVLGYLVRRSVEIKAEVVSEDERESGRRAILNAGHTVAHALEAASQYQLPHGEAVALGLLAECALAERMGVAEPGLAARVQSLFERLGLPVRLPESVDYSTAVRRMSVDKKNRKEQIHIRAGAHAWPGWLDHSNSCPRNGNGGEDADRPVALLCGWMWKCVSCNLLQLVIH